HVITRKSHPLTAQPSSAASLRRRCFRVQLLPPSKERTAASSATDGHLLSFLRPRRRLRLPPLPPFTVFSAAVAVVRKFQYRCINFFPGNLLWDFFWPRQCIILLLLVLQQSHEWARRRCQKLL
ncbi:unnamed protein product, partial [Musa acuminata subsp. burmannicoides]